MRIVHWTMSIEESRSSTFVYAVQWQLFGIQARILLLNDSKMRKENVEDGLQIEN